MKYMKHLLLLLTLACIGAPALIAMHSEESNWIEKMGEAYTNRSLKDMSELIRQKPNFVKSEYIDIFHRLLASNRLLSRTPSLALVLNHGAPIVTNTSDKNKSMEHELLMEIIALGKNPVRFNDAVEEARMFDACKTVGKALLHAQKMRIQQQEEEFNKLFAINPGVASQEASHEVRTHMLPENTRIESILLSRCDKSIPSQHASLDKQVLMFDLALDFLRHPAHAIKKFTDQNIGQEQAMHNATN